MNKKIVGFFSCLLFLFSAVPIVNGADCTEDANEKSLHRPDNAIEFFEFGMFYGRIIFNGIEYSGLVYLYNMTAINVKALYVCWDKEEGLQIQKGVIYQDCFFYRPVGSFLFHGFITKNFVFWFGIKLWF